MLKLRRNEEGYQPEFLILMAIVAIVLAIAIPLIANQLKEESQQKTSKVEESAQKSSESESVQKDRAEGTLLRLAKHVGVLLLGAFLISFLSASAGEEQQFSLPVGNIVLVTLVGAILSVWFSWMSTGIILGLYATYGVINAVSMR